jgi:hypothetical protein
MAKWYSEYPEYSKMSKVDYDVRCAIEGVLNEHTTEMENYSYYGSNPGILEDVYDDVAEDIMTKLNLWEKKDA